MLHVLITLSHGQCMCQGAQLVCFSNYMVLLMLTVATKILPLLLRENVTLVGNKLSLLKKSYARLLDTEGMLPACLLLFYANSMPRLVT